MRKQVSVTVISKIMKLSLYLVDKITVLIFLAISKLYKKCQNQQNQRKRKKESAETFPAIFPKKKNVSDQQT